jgi:hypothetical protein
MFHFFMMALIKCVFKSHLLDFKVKLLVPFLYEKNPLEPEVTDALSPDLSLSIISNSSNKS